MSASGKRSSSSSGGPATGSALVDLRHAAGQALGLAGTAVDEAALRGDFARDALLSRDEVQHILDKLGVREQEKVDQALEAISANSDGKYSILDVLLCIRLWTRPSDVPRAALMIIDMQNDFCEGGSLAVTGGKGIVETINKMRESAPFDIVVLSKDWHPANHISFASQCTPDRVHPDDKDKKAAVFQQVKLPNGSIQCLWPDHCVQNSFGAEIVDGLLRAPSDYVVHKGTNPDVDSYSALYDNNRAASTGLGEQLKDAGIKRVFVCGLAFDYCVSFSALDAATEGFETYVVEDAARPVAADSAEKMKGELAKANVRLVSSSDVKNLVLAD